MSLPPVHFGTCPSLVVYMQKLHYVNSSCFDIKRLPLPELPCNERNFVLQIPCIVETIYRGEYHPSVTPDDMAKGVVDTLDLQAQFIRLLGLRRKVLRYVLLVNRKHLVC